MFSVATAFWCVRAALAFWLAVAALLATAPGSRFMPASNGAPNIRLPP
jgi:hypothetical protein